MPKFGLRNQGVIKIFYLNLKLKNDVAVTVPAISVECLLIVEVL